MKVLISYGTSGLTQYSVGPDVLATIKSFPLICLPTLVTPCSFASQTVALLGGGGGKVEVGKGRCYTLYLCIISNAIKPRLLPSVLYTLGHCINHPLFPPFWLI